MGERKYQEIGYYCPYCEELEASAYASKRYNQRLMDRLNEVKQEKDALKKKVDLLRQPSTTSKKKLGVDEKEKTFDNLELEALRLKVKEQEKELIGLRKKIDEKEKLLVKEQDLRKRSEKELNTNREHIRAAIEISKLNGYFENK
jgi:predicted  nucleic acid-binding Zn-ribbon protein